MRVGTLGYSREVRKSDSTTSSGPFEEPRLFAKMADERVHVARIWSDGISVQVLKYLFYPVRSVVHSYSACGWTKAGGSRGLWTTQRGKAQTHHFEALIPTRCTSPGSRLLRVRDDCTR